MPRDLQPAFVRKTKARTVDAAGLSEVRGYLTTLYFIGMKENAKPEFDFNIRLRMSDRLARWLIGAILAGGSAATAAAHWIH